MFRCPVQLETWSVRRLASRKGMMTVILGRDIPVAGGLATISSLCGRSRPC